MWSASSRWPGHAEFISIFTMEPCNKSQCACKWDERRIPFSPDESSQSASHFSLTLVRPFPACLVPKNGHRVLSSVTENGVCVFSQVLISDAATADEYEEIQLDPGNAILPDTAVDRSGDFLYVLTTTKVSISIKRTHPESRHQCPRATLPLIAAIPARNGRDDFFLILNFFMLQYFFLLIISLKKINFHSEFFYTSVIFLINNFVKKDKIKPKIWKTLNFFEGLDKCILKPCSKLIYRRR